MENAEENKMFAARIRHSDRKLPEWTARDTPQQNSPAGVGFATIAGRARSMLQDANIPSGLRKCLMLEAVKTATHLDGLVPVDVSVVCSRRHSCINLGAAPPFTRALRTWGEAGTVTLKSRNFQPKEKGRGVTCIMVGYSLKHPAGTYRMSDPATNGIHLTRDVTWLRRKLYPDSPVLEAGEGVVLSFDKFPHRTLVAVPAENVNVSSSDLAWTALR
jgi:hypothetical protein